MKVGELKEILNEFDDDHPVVVKDEATQIKHFVCQVCWDYDGKCTIVIDSRD